MGRKKIGFQKIASIILLLVLLLQSTAPAFAKGEIGLSKVSINKANVDKMSNQFLTSQQVSYDDFSEAMVLLYPYMRLTSDGIPQLTISRSRAIALGVNGVVFDKIVASMKEAEAGLKTLPRELRPVIGYKEGKYTVYSFGAWDKIAPNSLCVTIPKWALEAFGWLVVIVGGVEATVGLFVDATIFGLPAGAVLEALGIWTGMTGYAFLWWVDHYYHPHTICL